MLVGGVGRWAKITVLCAGLCLANPIDRSRSSSP